MTSINLQYIRGEIDTHHYIGVALGGCDLSEIADGCEGLEPEIVKVLRTAFWKLDGLDRSDPFWKPGNGLATIAKLPEYSKREIAKGNEISFWSWVDICISYFHFSSFLNPELWRNLDSDKLNVHWLVRTAWNYHCYSGSESSSNLAIVINSLNLGSSASKELENIVVLTEGAGVWAENVKRSLSQP